MRLRNVNISSTVRTEAAGQQVEMLKIGWTSFPKGIICMWSGAIADIPVTWNLCDGTNGTPDLRNRFVVCADADVGGVAKTTLTGSATQLGGDINHSHSAADTALTIAQIPSHKHLVPNVKYTANTTHQHANNAGFLAEASDPNNGAATVSETSLTGSGAVHTHAISNGSNVVPYYALAYIMKL